MSDQNLAIVRKSFVAWNALDAEGFAALVSEDYVWESDTLPAPVQGPQGVAELARMYFHGFPDSHLDIEGEHDAGDYVTTRWRATGTHRAEFMGIPATNKKVDIHG